MSFFNAIKQCSRVVSKPQTLTINQIRCIAQSSHMQNGHQTESQQKSGAPDNETHFGYQTIKESEKQEKGIK